MSSKKSKTRAKRMRQQRLLRQARVAELATVVVHDDAQSHGRLVGDAFARRLTAAVLNLPGVAYRGETSLDHEPSAWMRSALSRACAEADAEAAVAGASNGQVALGYLNPDLSAGDSVIDTDDNRTCDRCRALVPEDEPFEFGLQQTMTPRGLMLLLAFGLCVDCSHHERGVR